MYQATIISAVAKLVAVVAIVVKGISTASATTTTARVSPPDRLFHISRHHRDHGLRSPDHVLDRVLGVHHDPRSLGSTWYVDCVTPIDAAFLNSSDCRLAIHRSVSSRKVRF